MILGIAKECENPGAPEPFIETPEQSQYDYFTYDAANGWNGYVECEVIENPESKIIEGRK